MLTTIGLLLCLVAAIFFGIRVPDPSGWYEVAANGTVWGSLKYDYFFVGLDAKIQGQDHQALREYKGVKLDFFAQREDVLKSIFGDLDGLVGMDGETSYPISGTADLEDYVGVRSQKLISGISQEPEYREKYVLGGIEFSVDLQGNITYRLPTEGTVGLEKQMQFIREFVQALNMEANFDFEEPITTNTGLVLPVLADGLPVVAASRNFPSGNSEELWVLTFQGYDSLHMGLSLHAQPGEVLIQSYNTILPIAASSEIKSVISAQEAIEALKRNLGSIYISGNYPERHPYNITEIRLAYGAVYSDGGYILTPIWVFVDEQDLDWDYCFIVNALSGEVYRNISKEYSRELSQGK